MGIQTHQAKLHQPQAKSQDKAQPARPWGSQNLGALLAGGAPSGRVLGRKVDLPQSLQAKMERSFGMDLSGVELYESQAVADGGAQAVAQGRRIGFAPGALDFGSRQGQALLGHELSHLRSQALGQARGQGFLQDAALERQADREGALAAGGQMAASVTPLSGATPLASCDPMQAKKQTKAQKNAQKRQLEDRLQGEWVAAHSDAQDKAHSDARAKANRYRFQPNGAQQANREALSGTAAQVMTNGTGAAEQVVMAGMSEAMPPAVEMTGLVGSLGLAKLAQSGSDVSISDAGRAVGGAGALFQAVGSGIDLAANAKRAQMQAGKGDKAGAWYRGISAVGNAANMGSGIAKMAAYGLNSADVIRSIGSEWVPGLGIVSGGTKFIAGSIRLGSTTKARMRMSQHMKELGPANQRDEAAEEMYQTLWQARRNAKIRQMEGGMDMAAGALNVTGNAMTLGGVTALAGTLVSAAGFGLSFAKGIASNLRKKSMRKDTVDKALKLESEIQKMCTEKGVDRSTAKHAILRGMGFASGKRKEAFQHIAMTRSAELQRKAQEGDRGTIEILEDMGLSQVEDAEGRKTFSLQAIAEMLGMDSDTSWQHQMEDYRKKHELE